MNPDVEKRLSELEKKVDAIFVSVEKTRKYFLWTGIITVALIVLPMIGLIFAVPSFLNNYVGNINSLTNIN